jgi:mevalonate kinase
MRKYNSKILLFGEYSILLGSKALVIPFDRFYGSLVNPSGQQLVKQPSKGMVQWLTYLDGISERLQVSMDFKRLKGDLEQGVTFESNIPQQYGLGSSGALCAAIYENYALVPANIKDLSLLELKKDLSLLESFFHGSSSGADPLCSLLGQPLVLSSIDAYTTKVPHEKSYHVFLVDSLHNGNTGPLVEQFKQKWEDQGFVYNMMGHYIPINNKCIESMLNNDNTLEDNVFEISYFQMEYFTEMIPKNILPHWKYGLQKEVFSLKICGSGGGGFYLCFTSKFEETLEYFNRQQLPIMKVF